MDKLYEYVAMSKISGTLFQQEFIRELKKHISFDPVFLKQSLQERIREPKTREIIAYAYQIFGKQTNETYDMSLDVTNLEKRFVCSQEEFEKVFRNSTLYKRELRKKGEYIFGENPLAWYTPKETCDRKYILHIGPTNSGKTYESLQALKRAKKGAYLGPLRLLAFEIYEHLNDEGIHCDLKTGEEEKKTFFATHVSSTVEMANVEEEYDVVVIDEAQLIGDPQRGASWLNAILGMRGKEIHIIASENAEQLLRLLLQDEVVEVVRHTRSTKLVVEDGVYQKNDIRKGDAFIVFSRKKVLKLAAEIQSKGYKVSVIYGSMPPETRTKQVKQFNKGKTDVVVSTDAIGMGLNLPIKRIVLLEDKKFDGRRLRPLTSSEVKQIAGRAGRKGMYDIGYVSFAKNKTEMERLLRMKDAPIQKAYIYPPIESAVRFSEMKYKERMREYFTYWRVYEPKHSFLKKHTLKEERSLLLYAEDTVLEEECTLDELYPFLRLPIPKLNEEVKSMWYQHVCATIFEDIPLEEPVVRKDSLQDLENSYQEISLHMMFLLHQDHDVPINFWYQKREELAQGIFEELSKNLNLFQGFCLSCQEPIAWNYEGEYCSNCDGMRLLTHFNSYRTTSSF